MKPYIKTYLTYFGFDESDFIPCEVCGSKAVDIHHLDPRSTNKAKINLIDNLIGLCRVCHEKCNSRDFNDMARLIHRKKLLSVKTDHEIKRYI